MLFIQVVEYSMKKEKMSRSCSVQQIIFSTLDAWEWTYSLLIKNLRFYHTANS